MLDRIIDFSVRNKLIIILFTVTIALFGFYAVIRIPVGAVPDITNNQVQVITTSGNLSTQEIEQFITAPVEMEMANLPGVKEIRSVSKFGISVVTIVFRDDMGTYLPRQLIAEKIKTAAAAIPEGYGSPEMGPITTGLGEIYQYIVDVKSGYGKRYSAMELRTIQDWIIRRRLSGINGVVEINSWGGHLKQYEVAIDPVLLKSTGITLAEVYRALENNNSITGGSYIEKTNQSYFIRGDGQVKSLEEIGNIVVRNTGSVPVLVRDLATVRFGHANRFGAITANGKGETVLGQIMMLKDANSREVISEVKSRVAEIQKNLPEGVFINPILERSELIAKTSFTVVENLILGALIVMLTVLLLLGNLRSALVIASMIPLALLFTVSMMYIFGIDANLMSLGALDFGIIIDGAVIIVEYIALRMTAGKGPLRSAAGGERQRLLDRIAFDGASKMMKSALFGQVIILIVFIPILSLSGVEGKMFRPMAMAFCFAILGAMILGLTWLPVACSLFLKPQAEGKKNLSDRIMQLAYNTYTPVMQWSCNHKPAVFSAALLSLVLTVFLFLNMGGEFVPTLDEGDFVIQPVLKTGTSLSKTCEMTTRMENILIRSFPDEVDQIVSRIGAAEVPTDPMSMEEIDMIIKLRPKAEWKATKSKEELAALFKEALSVIPGIEYEFTQPIEMRFNELITGVRSDIAIKIFGDDLDYINRKALEIKEIVAGVPGAGDVILEKTSGLPQIRILYDRAGIARYGADIGTLNTTVGAAFGGKTTGVVFEGEKRFDLVMRFDERHRTDISGISTLQVPVAGDRLVPLSELADIQYTEGPARISRENTHRRVVVSVNVRDRDLQSVIHDIQERISQKITLEPGNYIRYGGQFENLQSATRRLMLAIPVAMLLIFIFLHFAFKSMKDAIMIYTAIPLSTVGGVILLWMRGLPFSVSAGVGFIALFGIAVLNGIVLIEHLKELQHQGITDIRELILKGTRNRLRPVMLTAAAAAMGFLPMAVSSGAGAEVQRPLATVVIGGLITSTMLTMIALPLLFEVFYRVKGLRLFPGRKRTYSACWIGLLMLLPAAAAQGQPKVMSLDEALQIALENNREAGAYALKTDRARLLQKTAFSPDKATFTWGKDQNNLTERGNPLTVWGVSQDFSFPSYYMAVNRTLRLEARLAGIRLALVRQSVKANVAAAYFTLRKLQEQEGIIRPIDSLYRELATWAEHRSAAGEATRLEALTIRARSGNYSRQLAALVSDKQAGMMKLKTLMNFEGDFTVPAATEPVVPSLPPPDSLPVFELLRIENALGEALVSEKKHKTLPGLSLNYFVGTNRHEGNRYYQGFEAGLSVPVFFGSGMAEIRSSRIEARAVSFLNEDRKTRIRTRLNELNASLEKYRALAENYLQTGKPLYEEIMRTSLKSYRNGEITFHQFVTGWESAVEIRMEASENLCRLHSIAYEIICFSE